MIIENSIYTNPEVYDLLFGDFLSEPQLTFYEQLINRFGEPVLELGCGTGKVTIPLAKKGYKMMGLDVSREMIDLANKKKDNLDLAFHLGDMRDFRLSSKFSFVFIPAQSFQHLLTLLDVIKCLNSVGRHLTDEGALLIQIFNPSFEILSRSPTDRLTMPNVYIWDEQGGCHYSIEMQTEYDKASQLLQTTYYLLPEFDGREKQIFTLYMRQFFPMEIDALLELNGYRILAKYGDNEFTPFHGRSKYQILLAQKVKG